MGYYSLHLYLFFILLLIYTNQREANKPLESPFYIVTGKKLLIIPITIGTPIKTMNLVIDINAEYTWLSSDLYYDKQSSSYKALNGNDINCNQDAFSYRGVLSTDVLSIGMTSIKEFPFALVSSLNNNKDFIGVIALSNTNTNKGSGMGNSLIDQLRNYNAISIKSFSLKYVNQYEGIISFGNTIDAITTNNESKSHISKCQLENNKNSNVNMKWSCRLDYIVFGPLSLDNDNNSNNNDQITIDFNNNPNVIPITQLASFETIYDTIHVPKKHFDYIKEHIFHIDSQSNNNSSNSEKCYSHTTEDGINEILCPIGVHNTIPQLTFIFNDQALTIGDPKSESESMFHCKNDICEYHLIHIDGNEQWQLGYHFLKHFTVVFNQDYNAVYFTSEHNNHQLYMPSNTSIRKIGYIFMFILITGVSFLLFVMFIKGKNYNKKMEQSHYYNQFNNNNEQLTNKSQR